MRTLRARFGIVFERQRLSERQHIALVVAIANGGAPERVDGVIDSAALHRLLTPTEPFSGVPKAHLAVARRDGARDQKRGDGDDDEGRELEDLPMNER